MNVPPEAFQVAAAAYHAANCPVKGCGEYSVAERRAVTDALVAAAPLIRAAERERIAKLAEQYQARYWAHNNAQGTYHLFADLIREEAAT